MTTPKVRPRLTDPVVDKNGRLTSSWEAYFRNLSDTAALDEAVASSDATAAALSEFGWPIFIEYPDDKAYRACLKSPIAFTIESVTTRTTAGTCTVTVSIDGVNLGGTANSASTTESTQAHASANSVAVDADVEVTISANASAENLAIMLKCRRTL